MAGLFASYPGEEEIERALVAFLTVQEALDEFILSWAREQAKDRGLLDEERRG